jgi:hypothetical protein
MIRELNDMFERAVKQKLTTARRNDPALLKFCMQKLEEATEAGALLVDLPKIIDRAVTEFDTDIPAEL